MFWKQQTFGYAVSQIVCLVEKRCAVTLSDQMHRFDLLGHKADAKIPQLHIKEGTRAKSRYQGLGLASNTLATS